jgi:hypothetical protein
MQCSQEDAMAVRLVAAVRSARVSTAVWDELDAGAGKDLDKLCWWQCVKNGHKLEDNSRNAPTLRPGILDFSHSKHLGDLLARRVNACRLNEKSEFMTLSQVPYTMLARDKKR